MNYSRRKTPAGLYRKIKIVADFMKKEKCTPATYDYWDKKKLSSVISNTAINFTKEGILPEAQLSYLQTALAYLRENWTKVKAELLEFLLIYRDQIIEAEGEWQWEA